MASMRDEVVDQLGNLLEGVLSLGWALLLAFVLIWLARKGRRRLRRSMVSHGRDASVVTIVDNCVRITVLIIVALVAFGALTGDTSTSVTVIGLVTAAISLSLQDVLRNFVSGLYLLIERPFAPGDMIRVLDQSGKVERVDIRTTVIRNRSREEVYIPNFTVFSQVVRRQTEYEPHSYTVTSPYPVTQTYDAIWNAARSVQGENDPKAAVQIAAALEDSVEFDVIIWDPPGMTRSDAFIAAVKSTLEKASIRYNKP
ncbi:MAG: mechanosensitive ion channel family protein [Thermomicrobiales bacterium]|nr:mechanosensitive ion channel family protein [Thermomicrobiales bacterium]